VSAGSIVAPVPSPVRSVSVVVPVRDERKSLRPLVDELLPVLDALPLERAEVILVDDGSGDGSAELIRELAEEHPAVVGVELRRNFGKGVALLAGFREANGDAIVTMDGDQQDDPAEIPRLLEALAAGADLVSGWKAERRDPWSRRMASRLFNATTGRASGVRLHDLNCGLKAYRAEVVRTLPLTGDLYRFIPVLAAQEGFRVTELPVNHRPRVHGRSRYGLERYLRGFLDLLTILFVGRYGRRPMHLFGGLGVLALITGVVICAYLSVLRLSGEGIGTRPLLLLGVLLIVVGLQLLTIGLVTEMIQRFVLRSERDLTESRVRRTVR
jgi:glycosyltransferase involved in cell wall biosynthesis